jgi:hypothetical protein
VSENSLLRSMKALRWPQGRPALKKNGKAAAGHEG